MGGIDNISKKTLRRARRSCFVGIVVGIIVMVLISLLGASPGFAESGPSDPARSEPDRSVSTSPTASTTNASPTATDSGLIVHDAPPLTRAATKRRIDEMSPMQWLSHFGAVSIAGRE